MEIKIALAGNPNCGKTTLFNALTGSNQFVGNWPGVTVEKKEGKLKKHKDVTIMDLPGIYSLSPYTLEEVVARNYLVGERPDAILNIIDGTNLERNLYLTTQLTELGIPVVVAINMIDLVKKNGDSINIDELSRQLGCKVMEISALKGTGIMEAAEAAIKAAGSTKTIPMHSFNGAVEHAIAHIEEAAVHDMPEEQQRWYAVKIFERDDKVLAKLDIPQNVIDHIEKDIQAAEKELDDDAESIITNERYIYIASIIKSCYKKKNKGKLTTSDKIDKVVTNRWLGLPIFAVIMFLVYYISMQTVGTAATDWANDGLFGDGWHLFGIGSSQAAEAEETYGDSDAIIEAFNAQYGNDDIAEAVDLESENYSEDAAKAALAELVNLTPSDASVTYSVQDEETLEITETPDTKKSDLEKAVSNYLNTDYKEGYGAPDAAKYGIWVPGIPVLIGNGLDAINCADWLNGLILDGIVAGVGAVLGFVPQMLVLFLFLAFLESCGYMARIAFVLDRIFRKFGLSGKSFIPMLVGTGCGVPGIMASRTIENERDRRMTIMTTTFIPCGAKQPFIAMIAGAVFGGSPWIATSAYFIGMAAIVVSGIMLKKTKMFSGDPAPFVMELPQYHIPSAKTVLLHVWERLKGFIIKAGTILFLATVIMWILSSIGNTGSGIGFVEDSNDSIMAILGGILAPIFAPLGFGKWQPVAASISGFSAKESIVSTMGVLANVAGDDAEDTMIVGAAIKAWFPTAVAAFSFLLFNLLDSPCLAAISTMAHEMQSRKWFWFAILFQNIFAYVVTLCVYQIGLVVTGAGSFGIGTIVALILAAILLFLLFRPDPYKNQNDVTKRSVQAAE